MAYPEGRGEANGDANPHPLDIFKNFYKPFFTTGITKICLYQLYHNAKHYLITDRSVISSK